jgi:uncharacterized lipoprotein NlpE involved in copper resistance
MKKLFVLVAVATFAFASCGNKNQQAQNEGNVDNTTTTVEQTVVDSHNAKNSLDYKGTYNGRIPSASGEGILVSITLADSTYVKKMEYVNKKDATFEEKGTYTWNAAGNTITLQGSEAPNQYFVGENTLSQLDMDGNTITGDLADMYILKK